MREYLERLCAGKHLDKNETNGLFAALVQGELDPIEIAALLIALRAKGEQPDEIAGAAEALRNSAAEFPQPDYLFADSCGTGGDGANTINISTIAAIVAAELGLPMVKHGNRSVSSNCGSADLLERLGVKLDAPAAVSRRCLDEAGICFLFAPQYHSGMRHAGPVRQTLKVRTIFNILGPLVNPARPAYQVMGVYHPDLCHPIAQAFQLLGVKAALIVHGAGLDEIAVHGETKAVLCHSGQITEKRISPAEAGLSVYPLDQLAGRGPEENAQIAKQILRGSGEPAHCAAVAINVGALAWIADKAPDLAGGVKLAEQALASGRCYERLLKWAELSHGA